jgi:hypothetical protein
VGRHVEVRRGPAPMKPTGLPFVDEQATIVAAGPEEVWRALLDTLDRAFS